MTCVVGVRGPAGVLLAADSQTSGTNEKRMDACSKVFQLSDTMAIAYCGSGRFGQIVKHWLMDSLDEPPLDRDLSRWYVRDFAPVLRDVLADTGHLHVMEEDTTEYFGDSAFLLAVRDRLFAIEPDFSVNEHDVFEYDALGSGAEAAMGVLAASTWRGAGTWPVMEKLARRAVTAAADTTLYVGGTVRFARTVIYTADEKRQARQIVGNAPTLREDEGWYTC